MKFHKLTAIGQAFITDDTCFCNIHLYLKKIEGLLVIIPIHGMGACNSYLPVCCNGGMSIDDPYLTLTMIIS